MGGGQVPGGVEAEAFAGFRTAAAGLPSIVTHDNATAVQVALSEILRGGAEWDDLSLLKKKDLKVVNKRLAALFTALKREGIPEDQRQVLVGRLNHLLVMAIYHCPDVASGAEVQLRAGFETEARVQALTQTFGVDQVEYRWKVRKLVDRYRQETGNPFPSALVFPLSYHFTTGTHGSGERAAAASSYVPMAFDLMRTSRAPYNGVPVLLLDLLQATVTRRLTPFTLDEVASVRFVAHGDCFPWYDPDPLPGKAPFDPRPDPITLYLIFRGFMPRPAPVWRGDTPDVWNAIPEKKGLWRLNRGFLLVLGESPQSHTLYELSNLFLPGDDQSEWGSLLFEGIQRGEPAFRRRVKVYRGHEIVRRLAAIPVAPRQF